MRLLMSGNRIAALTAAFGAALFFSVQAVPAIAVKEPTQFLLTSRIGREVDKTKTQASAAREARNLCTTASHDECQIATKGEGTREFDYPEGIATSKLNGDVYVADQANHRVQVLDPEGSFLFMFGWRVDKTTGGNVCTATSGDECGPGEGGSGLAQQIGGGRSIAIDPVSGNAYVLDNTYSRVEEYSASGQFVLMIGGKVNKKGTNVCRAVEESECQSGQSGMGQGEFDELAEGGNVLTVGREDHLLYVGDSCPTALEACKSVAAKTRVQRFEADGSWVGQTSLSALSEEGTVTGVAVDTAGELFVTDSAIAGVREINLSGQLQSCLIDPAAEAHITGIAFDAYGRLGVLEHFSSDSDVTGAHGTLYEAQGAQCGTSVGGEIVPPSGQMSYGLAEGAFHQYVPQALSFNENEAGENLDRLYVVSGDGFIAELEIYKPAKFPIVHVCAPSEERFTTALICAEVNPNELLTNVFFKYWTLRETQAETFEEFEEKSTPVVFTGSGASFETVHDEITGLVPNQVYHDEAFVEAEADGERIQAGGLPPAEFHTHTPSPEVPGAPEALFVKSQSAVLQASLNPEHAVTKYRFEYAPCAGEAHTFAECGKRVVGAEQESAQYGLIAASQELTGLAPGTRYVFRLRAANRFVFQSTQEGGETISEREGVFTTAPLPQPQAVTGAAAAIGTTTATISGAVDPAGEPAGYVFELGVYNGAATQYGVVFSGQAGEDEGFVQKELALSGLQPGTTYAYRIGVRSGYVLGDGEQATGQTVTFTTAGVSTVIFGPPELAMLPLPAIKWPAAVKARPKKKCKRGYALDKHHRCAKIKASKKKRRGKRARAGGRRHG